MSAITIYDPSDPQVANKVIEFLPSAIFSSVGTNVKVNGHTNITPDTVNFVPGDTLQFLTASAAGVHDDVRVTAWFERTS